MRGAWDLPALGAGFGARGTGPARGTGVWIFCGKFGAARWSPGLPIALHISVVTAVEIWVGLARPRTPRAKNVVFEALLRRARVLAFDEIAPRQASTLRRYLEQAGREIGRMDPLIAAQAVAAGAVCVMDNLRHFMRIPGLTGCAPPDRHSYNKDH